MPLTPLEIVAPLQAPRIHPRRSLSARTAMTLRFLVRELDQETAVDLTGRAAVLRVTTSLRDAEPFLELEGEITAEGDSLGQVDVELDEDSFPDSGMFYGELEIQTASGDDTPIARVPLMLHVHPGSTL